MKYLPIEKAQPGVSLVNSNAIFTGNIREPKDI